MRTPRSEPRTEGCAALLGAAIWLALAAFLFRSGLELVPSHWTRLVVVGFAGAGLGLLVLGAQRLGGARRAEARRFSEKLGAAVLPSARETPRALRHLGLELPCSPDDVRRAYRRLARRDHPDAGGDAERFLRLRRAYREALEWLEAQPGAPRPRNRDPGAGT